MTNAELIKALREVANWIVAMSYNSEYAHDELKMLHYEDSIRTAADALEAADKRIDGLQKLVDINTERCEGLRQQLREAHESYEKHINELTTKCNQLQAAVDNYEKRIAELEAQLPKEGEWVYTPLERYEEYKVTCPFCGAEYHDCYDGYIDAENMNYCPNCGARMKGEQE